MMVRRGLKCALALSAAILASDSIACSPPHIDSAQELIAKADAIYRVLPEGFDKTSPTVPEQFHLLPETRVRFKVLDVIKGQARTSFLIPGSFARARDPNDHPVPYTMVRPGGRRGNCFATSYSKGQEYVVFLKDQTAYWSPLAPTNEEVTGRNDPWVVWIKGQTRRLISAPQRQ